MGSTTPVVEWVLEDDTGETAEFPPARTPLLARRYRPSSHTRRMLQARRKEAERQTYLRDIKNLLRKYGNKRREPWHKLPVRKYRLKTLLLAPRELKADLPRPQSQQRSKRHRQKCPVCQTGHLPESQNLEKVDLGPYLDVLNQTTFYNRTCPLCQSYVSTLALEPQCIAELIPVGIKDLEERGGGDGTVALPSKSPVSTASGKGRTSRALLRSRGSSLGRTSVDMAALRETLTSRGLRADDLFTQQADLVRKEHMEGQIPHDVKAEDLFTQQADLVRKEYKGGHIPHDFRAEDLFTQQTDLVRKEHMEGHIPHDVRADDLFTQQADLVKKEHKERQIPHDTEVGETLGGHDRKETKTWGLLVGKFKSRRTEISTILHRPEILRGLVRKAMKEKLLSGSTDAGETLHEDQGEQMWGRIFANLKSRRVSGHAVHFNEIVHDVLRKVLEEASTVQEDDISAEVHSHPEIVSEILKTVLEEALMIRGTAVLGIPSRLEHADKPLMKMLEEKLKSQGTDFSEILHRPELVSEILETVLQEIVHSEFPEGTETIGHSGHGTHEEALMPRGVVLGDTVTHLDHAEGAPGHIAMRSHHIHDEQEAEHSARLLGHVADEDKLISTLKVAHITPEEHAMLEMKKVVPHDHGHHHEEPPTKHARFAADEAVVHSSEPEARRESRKSSATADETLPQALWQAVAEGKETAISLKTLPSPDASKEAGKPREAVFGKSWMYARKQIMVNKGEMLAMSRNAAKHRESNDQPDISSLKNFYATGTAIHPKQGGAETEAEFPEKSHGKGRGGPLMSVFQRLMAVQRPALGGADPLSVGGKWKEYSTRKFPKSSEGQKRRSMEDKHPDGTPSTTAEDMAETHAALKRLPAGDERQTVEETDEEALLQFFALDDSLFVSSLAEAPGTELIATSPGTGQRISQDIDLHETIGDILDEHVELGELGERPKYRESDVASSITPEDESVEDTMNAEDRESNKDRESTMDWESTMDRESTMEKHGSLHEEETTEMAISTKTLNEDLVEQEGDAEDQVATSSDTDEDRYPAAEDQPLIRIPSLPDLEDLPEEKSPPKRQLRTRKKLSLIEMYASSTRKVAKKFRRKEVKPKQDVSECSCPSEESERSSQAEVSQTPGESRKRSSSTKEHEPEELPRLSKAVDSTLEEPQSSSSSTTSPRTPRQAPRKSSWDFGFPSGSSPESESPVASVSTECSWERLSTQYATSSQSEPSICSCESEVSVCSCESVTSVCSCSEMSAEAKKEEVDWMQAQLDAFVAPSELGRKSVYLLPDNRWSDIDLFLKPTRPSMKPPEDHIRLKKKESEGFMERLTEAVRKKRVSLQRKEEYSFPRPKYLQKLEFPYFYLRGEGPPIEFIDTAVNEKGGKGKNETAEPDAVSDATSKPSKKKDKKRRKTKAKLVIPNLNDNSARDDTSRQVSMTRDGQGVQPEKGERSWWCGNASDHSDRGTSKESSPSATLNTTTAAEQGNALKTQSASGASQSFQRRQTARLPSHFSLPNAVPEDGASEDRLSESVKSVACTNNSAAYHFPTLADRDKPTVKIETNSLDKGVFGSVLTTCDETDKANSHRTSKGRTGTRNSPVSMLPLCVDSAKVSGSEMDPRRTSSPLFGPSPSSFDQNCSGSKGKRCCDEKPSSVQSHPQAPSMGKLPECRSPRMTTSPDNAIARMPSQESTQVPDHARRSLELEMFKAYLRSARLNKMQIDAEESLRIEPKCDSSETMHRADSLSDARFGPRCPSRKGKATSNAATNNDTLLPCLQPKSCLKNQQLQRLECTVGAPHPPAVEDADVAAAEKGASVRIKITASRLPRFSPAHEVKAAAMKTRASDKASKQTLPKMNKIVSKQSKIIMISEKTVKSRDDSTETFPVLKARCKGQETERSSMVSRTALRNGADHYGTKIPLVMREPGTGTKTSQAPRNGKPPQNATKAVSNVTPGMPQAPPMSNTASRTGRLLRRKTCGMAGVDRKSPFPTPEMFSEHAQNTFPDASNERAGVCSSHQVARPRQEYPMKRDPE